MGEHEDAPQEEASPTPTEVQGTRILSWDLAVPDQPPVVTYFIESPQPLVEDAPTVIQHARRRASDLTVRIVLPARQAQENDIPAWAHQVVEAMQEGRRFLSLEEWRAEQRERERQRRRGVDPDTGQPDPLMRLHDFGGIPDRVQMVVETNRLTPFARETLRPITREPPAAPVPGIQGIDEVPRPLQYEDLQRLVERLRESPAAPASGIDIYARHLLLRPQIEPEHPMTPWGPDTSRVVHVFRPPSPAFLAAAQEGIREYGRQQIVQRIAQSMGVPPELLGDTTRTTTRPRFQDALDFQRLSQGDWYDPPEVRLPDHQPRLQPTPLQRVYMTHTRRGGQVIVPDDLADAMRGVAAEWQARRAARARPWYRRRPVDWKVLVAQAWDDLGEWLGSLPEGLAEAFFDDALPWLRRSWYKANGVSGPRDLRQPRWWRLLWSVSYAIPRQLKWITAYSLVCWLGLGVVGALFQASLLPDWIAYAVISLVYLVALHIRIFWLYKKHSPIYHHPR